MMRELEIERQFDIRIENMKPNRGVYYLKTDKGKKCLKKINYGIQKLVFIYGAKEHLILNGFNKIDRYDLSISGQPYAMVNEDIYTLSEWIEGRECDFLNDEDLVLATQNLARLHLASKGYEPPENSKLKTDLGRWPILMDKRVSSFAKMKNMVRKKKNKKTDFDLKYLTHSDYFIEYGKRAQAVLEDSEYFQLCEIAEKEKSFCHHDYTYHNIIIDENNENYIVDFDYCKREIRVYDLCNFIKKVLKRREWDVNCAKLIIDAYNSVSQLSEDEYRVLYAFLLFPQRFWRQCNRYYYNEVNWVQNTFNKKMDAMISEKESYSKFIEDFAREYNQKG